MKASPSFSAWFKSYLLEVLRKEFIQAALTKLFGTMLKVGGFKLWLAEFIAGKFWDEVGRPITLWGIRKGLLVYDRSHNAIIVARIKKAYNDSNQDDYDRHIDDLFD